jgi:hypothetical protein
MKKIFCEIICLIFLFQLTLGQTKKDTSVTVEAHITYQTGDTNLISYSSRKPLALLDFSGTPDKISRGDAETYSGIFVKYYFSHNHKQLIIAVDVLPYFDKTKSWCREESRNDKTLSHEQIHFDITAIKGCEMVMEIEAFHFSLTNYSKEIQEISNNKNQEAQDLQDQYDLETNHGRIADMQEKWKEIISQSLAKQLCYKEN